SGWAGGAMANDSACQVVRRRQPRRSASISGPSHQLEVLVSLVVDAPHVAATWAARHQRSVGVLDDLVSGLQCGGAVPLEEGLVTAHRAVHPRALACVRDDAAIADDEVVAEDHADVIEFEALAGVDATHLLD